MYAHHGAFRRGQNELSTNRHPARRGFTLIELLATIGIIVLLIAIALPAYSSVMTRVREASVKTEIEKMSIALGNFNSAYGMYPPSRIVLCEKASDWNNLANAEIKRSRGLIRQLWPQFDFTYDRYMANGYAIDINGDGDRDDLLNLNSGECLLFFLGGIMDGGPNNATPGMGPNVSDPTLGVQPTGFSKDPADPFKRGGSRESAFYEFDTRRFSDVDSSGPNFELMREYIDPLPGQTVPYMYFSSYGARGYDLTDLGGTGMTNIYRTSGGAPYRHNSFQIVSPGYDTTLGVGGTYDDAAADKGLGGRATENDNITNFSNGRLN